MRTWRDWLFGAKVRVLRLRPGDIVVLEASEPLSPRHVDAIKRQWAERFPDIDMAVLGGGLRLGGVVRQEDVVKGEDVAESERWEAAKAATRGATEGA